MPKTDSEMSEQGDESKPEQPSIPLQLNVVLRNAPIIVLAWRREDDPKLKVKP